jgi:hypothetical protein
MLPNRKTPIIVIAHSLCISFIKTYPLSVAICPIAAVSPSGVIAVVVYTGAVSDWAILSGVGGRKQGHEQQQKSGRTEHGGLRSLCGRSTWR